MPKWVPIYGGSRWFTESNFILSVLDILEELKTSAVRDHNIRITSATVSRPAWVSDKINCLFEEACLLADIEVLKQPQNRAAAATKTAPPEGDVLLLDHGPYYLYIYHFVWDERSEEYREKKSTVVESYGAWRFISDVVGRAFENYASNATEEEVRLIADFDSWDALVQASTSVNELIFGHEWTAEQYEDRVRGIALRSLKSRWTRTLNISGQDVNNVREQYIDKLSIEVQQFLERSSGIHDYDKAEAELHRLEQAVIGIIIARPPPSLQMASWLKNIDRSGYQSLWHSFANCC